MVVKASLFSVARAVAVSDNGVYLGGMFGSVCAGSTALGHHRYCPGDAFVARFAIAVNPLSSSLASTAIAWR